MKSFKKILIATFGLVGFAATSYAQETATATATATVVTPIAISKVTNMSFGNIAVQSANGGTVVLSTEGVRTAAAGVTLPATAGTVTAATFTVTGTTGYAYVVTLPTAVSLAFGSETMEANGFNSNVSGTAALTGGTHTLKVGATLNVAAAQAAGTYTSSNFDVTVNYN